MEMLKKFLAATFSALLLLTAPIPILALEQDAHGSEQIIQPRYSSIYQLDCNLSVNSNGTATVDAWVDFVSGNKCTIKVVLERNGSAVKTWNVSSSNGTVRVGKTATGLDSGKYQAIMYVTCDTDTDTVPSSTKTI